jgi:hypothetical protein
MPNKLFSCIAGSGTGNEKKSGRRPTPTYDCDQIAVNVRLKECYAILCFFVKRKLLSASHMISDSLTKPLDVKIFPELFIYIFYFNNQYDKT